MKSKFKVMDILRLIDKQHNMTKGGLYCANQVFELDSDIPIIETVDDYGLVVSLYETSFEATDVVLDFSEGVAIKEQEDKMSEEDAIMLVIGGVREFFCMCEEDDSKGFITKIKTDKELQKALLSLIRGAV
jgi:hypothetical protein